MHIILIRNYHSDGQESMRRFADMLERGFRDKGITVSNWTPVRFFGKLSSNTVSGIGKWLGYIDKWIVFPITILIKTKGKIERLSTTYFHVCDHSNSPYLKYLPPNRSGITCHDVLAIRGALGFKDAYCRASPFGKILQKMILKNLTKAKYLACVSNLTYRQLSELLPTATNLTDRRWTVIYNAFNADFKPLLSDGSISLLKDAGINQNKPYLLHVGSNLARKNRRLLLDMVALLGNSWHGNICFAGQALEASLLAYAVKLKLDDRVVSVVKPDHATLIALYSNCEAFVFPSFSEGFGWPLIEAQACGAPVIASDVEPMPEISGGAALHADPKNSESFVAAFNALKDKTVRKQLIEKGFNNKKRFLPNSVIESYIALYQSIIDCTYVS